MVFEMVDASRIHSGSYILIFKFLPSWKLVPLLGSPERHPSVILESMRMLEVPERSLGGFQHTGCPKDCLLYTSPSPRDVEESRMPSSA